MKVNAEETTVAQLVSGNIKTAHVFKKFGIDFCCGGGITIAKACERHDIDKRELLQELLKVNDTVDRSMDYQAWSTQFLIDHIINIHHAYVKESVPILLAYAEKVARVHGQHYSELYDIQGLVKSLCEELLDHMKKEERNIFPNMLNDRSKFQGMLINILHQAKDEHDEAGDILKQISELTNGFTPPAGACNTFKAYYAKLMEFEDDLHHHVHLENNILFPRISK